MTLVKSRSKFLLVPGTTIEGTKMFIAPVVVMYQLRQISLLRWKSNTSLRLILRLSKKIYWSIEPGNQLQWKAKRMTAQSHTIHIIYHHAVSVSWRKASILRYANVTRLYIIFKYNGSFLLNMFLNSVWQEKGLIGLKWFGQLTGLELRTLGQHCDFWLGLLIF